MANGWKDLVSGSGSGRSTNTNTITNTKIKKTEDLEVFNDFGEQNRRQFGGCHCERSEAISRNPQLRLLSVIARRRSRRGDLLSPKPHIRI